MAIHNPKGLHHTEHEPAGIDALVTLDGGILLTGTIPDARHSTNIPRLNASNIFTVGGQEIQSTGADTPRLRLRNLAAAANARGWQLNVDTAGILYWAPINDDGSGQALYATLDRSANFKTAGDHYEKNRTTPMGHWVDVPYSAGNYAADVGSWGVDAGDLVTHAYMVIGKTLWLTLYINSSSVSGGPTSLRVAFPAGFTIARGMQGLIGYSSEGLITAANITATQIGIAKTTGGAWGNTTNGTFVFGTFPFSIV